ncbi:MAG: YraN family protein [Clostridia bacterium]|nr:YraN family protein [Clostridia bacterium]
MSGVSSYSLGRAGEALAADLLIKNGYFIAAKNYRSQLGEIDIIAENRDTVLFVEVKLRKAKAGYFPREAVTLNKRRRILHAAKNYIFRSRTQLQPRFDIIEIIMNERQDLKDADVNWIQNAFGVRSNEFI